MTKIKFTFEKSMHLKRLSVSFGFFLDNCGDLTPNDLRIVTCPFD